MKHTFLLLLLLLSIISRSQVNGYAAVDGISGSTLTVSSVNESYDTFEDGESVLIIQMQDDVIGNTSNTGSFGDLGSIRSAGLFEIHQIDSHTESAGVPTTITVSGSLNNTYYTGANSSVQVVTFPTLGSPDYTTTAAINAIDWNGTIGGIVAFNVNGTLTLNHSISVDEQGFRGGNKSVNYYPGGSACDGSYYYTTSNHTRNGEKGEGIYKTSTINYDYARGKILTGGGGGNALINAGGGGGGNFSTGGDGGPGWSGGAPSGCTPSAGGLGGISLSAHHDGSRAFLGGGGGGGQQNNSNASDGGNGGGIILIKADEIQTNGSCGGVSISANGETPSDAGNDGQGGGGAAGTIILDVVSFSISGSCPLIVEASGGDGASTTSGSTHAGGGGGGQGAIFYSSTEPTTNVTTNTSPGNGGCNNSGCSSSSGDGGGSNGDGIFDTTIGPLPVELIDFNAHYKEGNVYVKWRTLTEINNDYFSVLRSRDGINWESIGKINGAGNSTQVIDYEYVDVFPGGNLLYYKLEQTDFDGAKHYSNVVALKREHNKPIVIFPNPISNSISIQSEPDIRSVNIFSSAGKLIKVKSILTSNMVKLITADLPSGIYFIEVETVHNTYWEKVVKQ